MGAMQYFPLAEKLTLTEALELAKDLFVEDAKGDKWIKLDSLKQLMADRPEPLPKIRSFEAAKLHAAADPELQELKDRPPNLGPTPAAA